MSVLPDIATAPTRAPRRTKMRSFGPSPTAGAMGRTPRSSASPGMSQNARVAQYADTTEDDFHRMLDENPDDHQTRQVFADWLQERNDPRAEGYRALGALQRRPEPASSLGEHFFGNVAAQHHFDNAERFAHTLLPQEWFARIPRETAGRFGNAAMWRHRKNRREAEDTAAHAFSLLPPEEKKRILNPLSTQASRYEQDRPEVTLEQFPDAVETDPRHLRPINKVIPEKSRGIQESMEKGGWTGYPLLAVGSQALTGSHRLDAADHVHLSVPVVFLDSGDFLEAAKRVHAIKPEVRPRDATFGDIMIPDDEARLKIVTAMNHPLAVRIMQGEIQHNAEFGGKEGWEREEWAPSGGVVPQRQYQRATRYADTTEDDFHRMLDENPDDHHTRLVFADWLQERNDPRAEGYRALGALRKYPRYNQRHTWTRDSNELGQNETVDADPHGPNYVVGEVHGLPFDWFSIITPQDTWWTNHTSRQDAEDAAAHAFSQLPQERRNELLNPPPTQLSRYGLTESERIVLVNKQQRSGREASARHRLKRSAMSPEDGFNAIRIALERHGEVKHSDLSKMVNMHGSGFEAALDHGLKLGHLRVNERHNHPKGGGPKGRFWSLRRPEDDVPVPASRFSRYPLGYADATDHQSFQTAINKNPADAITRGVYADWLEENDSEKVAPATLDFLRKHSGRAWVHQLPEGAVIAGKHWTVPEMKEANKAAGRNWFAPDTMRLFGTRLFPKHVYSGPGGVYFVHEDDNFDHTAKQYQIAMFHPKTGETGTWTTSHQDLDGSEFIRNGIFPDADSAVAMARAQAAGTGPYKKNRWWDEQKHGAAVAYPEAPPASPIPSSRYGTTRYADTLDPQDQASFETAIDADPLDATNHLVYSDWLRDRGHHDEADFRKAMGEWFKEQGRFAEPRMNGDNWTSDSRFLPAGVSDHHIMWTEDTSPWTEWSSYRHMEDAFRRSFTRGRQQPPAA